MSRENLNIRETAEFLGVSIQTLRIWDKIGKLKAIRKGEKGHRYYALEDLELFKVNLFDLAIKWTSDNNIYEPEKQFYCQNISIFQARLTYLIESLRKFPEFLDIFSLLTAIIGEIGDNSFAHNLGNWPDVPGIFFGYNINKREIALADRGQGIFYTLKRVKPELKNHKDALKTAFTEIISGRALESRGNGLKFVRQEISKIKASLFFQSGNALLKIKNENELDIKKSKIFIRGCFAFIKF